jgi:hypothetical protein
MIVTAHDGLIDLDLTAWGGVEVIGDATADTRVSAFSGDRCPHTVPSGYRPITLLFYAGRRRRCRMAKTIAVMMAARTGTPIAKFTQTTLTIPVLLSAAVCAQRSRSVKYVVAPG